MKKPHFLSFNDVSEEMMDIGLVGGKAATLIRLYKESFLVPEGFVITTNFFEHCLGKELGSCLDETAGTIISHVNKHCHRDLVAVRSSVTTEDSAKASFAGQFDSFLNVDKTQVLGMIDKCWRSLHNPRAASYAQLQDNDQLKKMAVIVQDMVKAEVSGVAFSIDPVTGEDSLVIEAVLGSNELLVQGVVTPDYYKIDKNLNLLDKSVVTQNGFCQQKLSDAQIKMVGQLVVQIKEFFGAEVDIEWAIEDNQLYVLQSRPITAIQNSLYGA